MSINHSTFYKLDHNKRLLSILREHGKRMQLKRKQSNCIEREDTQF